MEFGIGRSGLPAHYQGFNIPYVESRDRFLETLDILKKAWTQERFSHKGRYFEFNDVCIMPKPYQKPHPPIRMAATTKDTYALVGRLGFSLFVAPRTTAISDLERLIGGYHEGRAAAGLPAGDIRAERLGTLTFDDVLREHAVFGSPERVTRSMRLFAERVIPRLN